MEGVRARRRLQMVLLFALLFAKWDAKEDFQHIRIKIQLQRDMCHITLARKVALHAAALSWQIQACKGTIRPSEVVNRR